MIDKDRNNSILIEPCGCTDSIFSDFKSYFFIEDGFYIECIKCGAVWDIKSDDRWLERFTSPDL